MKDVKQYNYVMNQNTANLSRRKFLKIASTGLAILSFPMSSTFAGEMINKNKKRPKIIWLLLRGALDSMHTVIPTFEPQYKVLRPTLSASFKAPLLPLEKGFALHPSLKNLHAWYKNKSLLPIVAVSSGYQQRSHFDGQDYLESGKSDIDHDSGWLARAIEVKNKRALAVSRSTPISLRHSDKVNTWYPSKLQSADDDIYSVLTKLYQDDHVLKEQLMSGLEVRAMVGDKKNDSKKRKGKFIDLTKSCAKFMVGEQGLDCAMLELTGWDTHNNQSNRLSHKLTELDNGLAELKAGLATEWQNTVVVIATEFGRTAQENGTGGTDHGTASALFLAGGAVKGGKVQGSWPGLSTEALFEQRDLMPTSNSFSWIANVLSQHWHLSTQELKHIFPNIKAYDEMLIRT